MERIVIRVVLTLILVGLPAATLSADQELLLNGGFEEGDAGVPYGNYFGDTFPVTAPNSLDHWSTSGGAGRWYGAYKNHTPDGNRCIATWDQYTYAYQGVNLVGGLEYTLSAWCQPFAPDWPAGVGGILEIIWFPFRDATMDDYSQKISRETVVTFVPGEFDYDIWTLVSGAITAPAEAESALVLVGNKDGAGWTSGVWDDVSLTVPELPPMSCADVHSRGYGLEADLDADCEVNLADFAIFASQWLMCDNPEDQNCQPTW